MPNLRTEIIVVDDGSTDETAQLIAKLFPEVIYHYQSNQGVSAARNQGLRLATGEWLALLDSDDEWLPTKLARQFELLNKTGLLVCHTDEIWIRNDVRVNQMKKHLKQGGWIFQHCLPLCVISPSTTLLHRSVLSDVGDFDESLTVCEDYDLWLRIAAKYEIAFDDTPLVNKYGGHADQLSRQYWGMDRFRVIALDKILATELSHMDHAAAKNTLISKLQLLLSGAIKHNNQLLVDECASKLSYWNADKIAK